MFQIWPESINYGVASHADFRNDTSTLAKAIIGMLAVDIGAKMFHNLTTIWGYFKMEF